MAILFYKRAIQDILNNRFLNTVTIVTIALSVFIVSAFLLFFVNVTDLMSHWKKGIRLMAYLKAGISEQMISGEKDKIEKLPGVQTVRFIPRQEALSQLMAQMKRQSSLFQNLDENPLPEAFEVLVKPSHQDSSEIESLAIRIQAFSVVEEVEYGQKWLGRFTNIFKLFSIIGYAMCGLFFMAAVFIMANTIRLVLYQRREEIEIMRLVGATDGFIHTPFYIQGLIQGALGAALGLGGLFLIYRFVSINFEQSFAYALVKARFLSAEASALIILVSMFVGWLGCFISLKQFLKV
ncbi:MAG: permease-like cell division protein FtsX [Desulfobacterales bacterium]|nr:permease-like cell division protein FtsX [Desulfobacterales bacterium]